MGKKEARKPVKKSARKSASKGRGRGQGRPFEKGYDPRRGKGPPKGQAGRPPNWFKSLMSDGVDEHAAEKVVRALYDRDVDDPRFWDALQFAARYSKRRAELETDEGERLPYVVIAPGPPAGVLKEDDDNE